ncbi:response regulator transcription factor [Stenotrophomonas terrae]|uniref:response regulator transcription factor n=1 Tax=Stenotrophomonas terrae TaxID=405446 RepID=UPI0032086C75
MTLHIILADDHPIVTSGVQQILELDATVRVVATAGSTDELVSALEQTPCDLVITDFVMPGENVPDGLALIGLIQRRWPRLPIIVLSRIANPAILRAIRDAGVNGLISKSDALTEIQHAVRSVAHGRRYMGKSAKKLLENASVDLETSSLAALSPREAEVLRVFVSGMSIKEIARLLNRSAKTISNQKLAAMDKLGIKTDVEVYAYASKHGLIT